MMTQITDSQEWKEDQSKILFKAFDRDGNGSIDMREVCLFLFFFFFLFVCSPTSLHFAFVSLRSFASLLPFVFQASSPIFVLVLPLLVPVLHSCFPFSFLLFLVFSSFFQSGVLFFALLIHLRYLLPCFLLVLHLVPFWVSD
jgi:hypothetical protein